MATKTISIDVEAYDRLKSVQRQHESFSQTIKRVIRKPADFESWLKLIEADPSSPQFIGAVEEQIAGRRRHTNRKR
jgi:predicted CopG family antitoxin